MSSKRLRQFDCATNLSIAKYKMNRSNFRIAIFLVLTIGWFSDKIDMIWNLNLHELILKTGDGGVLSDSLDGNCELSIVNT